MNAHIISIGDELLNGQTVNTNAAFIAKKLDEIEIKVSAISTIGDDEEQIKEVFQKALNENDFVLVTGGLGPTHDDITRKCIVDFFDTKLVKSDKVLKDIESLFASRGREVTPSNINQAFVPEIAQVIHNSKGTAPGTWITKENKHFISMPGVPFEMKEMVSEFIIPKIKDLSGFEEKKSFVKNLLTTGIPESYLYERLGNISEILKSSKLAFLPNQFGVKMRITVNDESLESSQNHLFEIEQVIRSKVGRYIYGTDDDKLEDVVARLLVDRDKTLAVAESCTGGLISSRLTDISGSSQYFERGLVTYSNGAKVELLKVDEDFIQDYGAVSLEVARQMAEGVRAVSGTDIGLAVTGIMGPTGASPMKPVGLVYVGICDETMVTAREFKFGDDRRLNKDKTSQAALEMLRRNLLGISYDE